MPGYSAGKMVGMSHEYFYLISIYLIYFKIFALLRAVPVCSTKLRARRLFKIIFLETASDGAYHAPD